MYVYILTYQNKTKKAVQGFGPVAFSVEVSSLYGHVGGIGKALPYSLGDGFCIAYWNIIKNSNQLKKRPLID